MKKSLRFALLALLSWMLLEAASLALFPKLAATRFDLAELDARRAGRLEALEGRAGGRDEGRSLYQLHPYLGYAGRPTDDPLKMQFPVFNSFGVQSPHPYPYAGKSDNEYVIAVLGGSVAAEFALSAEAGLQAALAARNQAFKERKIVLLNLAIVGYKQPQQLFHLEYALLSGFQIDAVLNIDGFNDLVMAVQNAGNGINPIFPSGHHTAFLSKLTLQQMDPATIGLLGDLLQARSRERRLLSTIQRAPFRYSPFLNLAAIRWVEKNERTIAWIQAELATGGQESITKEYRGPALAPGDEYARAVRIWAEASRMTRAVSMAFDLPYIHVLQPNQYYAGSKALTETEKRVAYRPEGPWGAIAVRGYPRLVAEGAQLRAQGEAFHDLTLLFRDEPGDAYRDECCHFTGTGSAIFLDRIADILATEIK